MRTETPLLPRGPRAPARRRRANCLLVKNRLPVSDLRANCSAGPAILRGALIACAVLLLSGCATYHFGSRSLFREDVRTVYVSIARNETFRHDLGPRLTEAVVREIELRTPYKVVGTPTADSTLNIQITHETKSVLTRALSNEPRALDAIVSAVIHWNDRQGNPILQNQFTVEASLATRLLQGTRFVPEAGQSVQTALQETIDELADQIVSQMEMRW